MSPEMNNKSGPAKPRRRGSILVPLFFFVLGILSTMGYLHWKPMGHSTGGMQMQEPGTAPETVASVAEKKKKKEPRILYYVDPMNPTNKSDHPGKAPCGMDMVPVYEEELSAENLPPGTIKLSPEKQQLIGVQFGEAAEMPLVKTIRAVGRATYDETKLCHVHTKFAGWLENVQVDFVGQLVKKNQPLFNIYSPDLVATQQELLIAKKSRDYLEKSQIEGVASQAVSLYNATRERLKLWDISDAQVKQIEKQGTPLRSITIYAPMGGFVLARKAYPGHQITPELELYTLADLSNMWIIAEIYEYEIPFIHLGQKAAVFFPSFPGKTFAGKITYISPDMDPKTRTLKVRVELPNADYKIKPDMFANVELSVEYGNKLSIPQEAVLDSGASQTVFVAREGGYFEPRPVTLGPKVDNRYIVMAGLQRGEQVVTSANFLIDSESQLKSATGGMSGGGAHAGHGGGQPAAAPAPGADNPEHAGHGGQSPPAKTMPETPAGTDHSGHVHQ